jgi:hypothetical protein
MIPVGGLSESEKMKRRHDAFINVYNLAYNRELMDIDLRITDIDKCRKMKPNLYASSLFSLCIRFRINMALIIKTMITVVVKDDTVVICGDCYNLILKWVSHEHGQHIITDYDGGNAKMVIVKLNYTAADKFERIVEKSLKTNSQMKREEINETIDRKINYIHGLPFEYTLNAQIEAFRRITSSSNEYIIAFDGLIMIYTDNCEIMLVRVEEFNGLISYDLFMINRYNFVLVEQYTMYDDLLLILFATFLAAVTNAIIQVINQYIVSLLPDFHLLEISDDIAVLCNVIGWLYNMYTMGSQYLTMIKLYIAEKKYSKVASFYIPDSNNNYDGR